MSSSERDFLTAVSAWPVDTATLPAHVQAVYQAWMALPVSTAKASEAASPVALPEPDGRRHHLKEARCKLLTLSLTPFPTEVRNPPTLLTPAEVASFGTPPAPSVGGGGNDSAADSVSRLEALVRDLQEENRWQRESINKLILQTESMQDEAPASSGYNVRQETLDKFPATHRNLNPMPRVERKRLKREFSGFYPKDSLPKDLHIPDNVRTDKGVAAAKITLLSMTKDVIQPLMDGNSDVLRMTGTVHSRVLDSMSEMRDALEERSDNVVEVQDVLDDLTPIYETVTASLELILDLHARMRTAVTSRVERAMGFADLHADPNKREKESFLSEDFEKRIEEKAKEKAHLAWAKSGTGSAPRDPLHGQPPPKSSGGGQKQPWKRGKGNRAGGPKRANQNRGDSKKDAAASK